MSAMDASISLRSGFAFEYVYECAPLVTCFVCVWFIEISQMFVAPEEIRGIKVQKYNDVKYNGMYLPFLLITVAHHFFV